MFTQPDRPIRIAVALAAALSLAACAATARPGAVNTSRMGVVKGTGIVAPGVVQLEAGYVHAERGERTRDVLGEALLRVGLGRDTELRATLPSYLHVETPAATTDEASDAHLAVKHRFRQPAGWLPGVSVVVGSTLPTGGHTVGAGEAQPEAVAAVEWRLPHKLWLVGTGGHRAAVFQGDRFGQNTLGVAGRAELTATVATQLEYSRVTATRAGAQALNQLRATAAYRLTRDLQLDGWVGRATQEGVPAETQLGLGFTRRW
jgi:hypothetical protein